MMTGPFPFTGRLKWNAGRFEMSTPPPPHITVFVTLHVLALVLHAANCGIGLYLIHSVGDYRSQLTVTGLTFEAPAANATTATCPNRAGNRPQVDQFVDQRCFGEFSGLLALVFTEGFTALAHIWYLLNLTYLRSDRWWTKGYHVGRWVEYSISATALSLANAVGVGFHDFAGVINLALSLFVVQFGGLALEVGVSPSTHVSPRAGWFAFFLAALLQAQSFLAVQVQVQSMEAGKPPGAPKNDFDGFQTIAWFYILSYCIFPALLVAYALPRTFGWQGWSRSSYVQIEFLFTVAGAVTKVSLFWIVFGTVLELFAYYGFSTDSGVSWSGVRIAAMAGGAGLFLAGVMVAATILRNSSPVADLLSRKRVEVRL